MLSKFVSSLCGLILLASSIVVGQNSAQQNVPGAMTLQLLVNQAARTALERFADKKLLSSECG